MAWHCFGAERSKVKITVRVRVQQFGVGSNSMNAFYSFTQSSNFSAFYITALFACSLTNCMFFKLLATVYGAWLYVFRATAVMRASWLVSSDGWRCRRRIHSTTMRSDRRYEKTTSGLTLTDSTLDDQYNAWGVRLQRFSAHVCR